MVRSFFIGSLILVVISFIPLTTNAALLSRLGGQLYYDTLLDVTWLSDANLATSEMFGVADIYPEGCMSWFTANDWIAAMNADGGIGYLGFNQWRMPQVLPLNGVSYNSMFGYDGLSEQPSSDIQLDSSMSGSSCCSPS